MPQTYSDDWRKALAAETRSRTRKVSEVSEVLVPGLTVLGHCDVRRIGDRAVLQELVSGRGSARLSRTEPDFSPPNKTAQLPLADPYLSRSPVHLAPTADDGVRLSCDETRTKVIADGVEVEDGREFSSAELERGVVLLLADRVALLLHRLDPLPPAEVPRFDLVGESASILKLRQEIQQVADLDVPVLLRGETGTGKELAAQAIHQAGPRRGAPLVAVNMGAIPPALAASELFGAAKGAFTGATARRVGYFSRAQGGTLFLDEVGDMPPDVQPMLLRALESNEIQPVGAELPHSIDVRIIAATDVKLEEEIESGRFREPLYHRLSGYEIRIPPLRQRRDDLGRLLVHFLGRQLEAIRETWRLSPAAPGAKPWLPAGVIAQLALYDWPGNVRQLQNVVRQLVISCRGQEELRLNSQVEGLLRKETATPAMVAEAVPAPRPARPSPAPRSRYRSPSEISEEELRSALRANRWRLKPCATQLGISRPSLYLLIDKFPDIRTAADLTPQEIKASLSRSGGDLEAMVEDLEVSRDGLKRRLRELGLP